MRKTLTHLLKFSLIFLIITSSTASPLHAEILSPQAFSAKPAVRPNPNVPSTQALRQPAQGLRQPNQAARQPAQAVGQPTQPIQQSAQAVNFAQPNPTSVSPNTNLQKVPLTSENVKLIAASKKPPAPAVFIILPEIGVTSLNYSETGATPFSGILINANLGMNFVITPKKVQIYSDIIYTGLSQLANNPITAVSLFGLNAGAIYEYHTQSGWKFAMKGGWFYNSMSVTNNQFGVSNLYGINLSPVIQKNFSSKMKIGAYFKFGPLIGTSSLSNMSNSAGIYWVKPFSLHHNFKVNFDYAFTNLAIGQSTVSLNAMTLSVSYTGFSLDF